MKNEKKGIRFLKKITILCVIMNLIITAVALFICLRSFEIPTGVLTALLGAWSIELTLSAFIKNSEGNTKTQEITETTEEEITEEDGPDPEKDSI